MAIQFSRSTRSLTNDRSFAGMVILVSTSVIILAWLMWFFFAPIAIYETSQEISVRRDGLLMVKFPESALKRILPGQTATFFPTTSQNDFGVSTPALVMDTPASTGREDGIVYIYLETGRAPAGLTGEVKIAVEYLSPLALILRARQ